MIPFMVTGLPRSRTAWLASFLSYGARRCVHEPTYHWSEPADLERWCAGSEGMSDSMACWIAHEAKRLVPRTWRGDMPLVLVRRPKAEVLASLAKFPYPKNPGLPAWLDRMNARMDRIEDDLYCLSVTFAELEEWPVCAEIFRHCHGFLPPMSWWERWKDENVQCDVLATVKLIMDREAEWMKVFAPRYREVV